MLQMTRFQVPEAQAVHGIKATTVHTSPKSPQEQSNFLYPLSSQVLRKNRSQVSRFSSANGSGRNSSKSDRGLTPKHRGKRQPDTRARRSNVQNRSVSSARQLKANGPVTVYHATAGATGSASHSLLSSTQALTSYSFSNSDSVTGSDSSSSTAMGTP